MNERVERITALALAVLGLAACVGLGKRQIDLRAAENVARTRLEQARNNSAMTTLNDIALPSNKTLSVCNDTGSRQQIAALADVYMNERGEFQIFNSAKVGWHTWDIPAGAEQVLQFNEGGTAWAGNALFYAMDVAGGGEERMLAGTAEDLKRGCIPLSGMRRELKRR